MAFSRRSALSRRVVLAALPMGVGVASGATARVALAQPAAADPVSFYLGQVLALATLQAEAVGRLEPLLDQPNTGDVAWQAGAAAEAGVIGAVAAVVGAMEPPPELTESAEELRLASASYTAASGAALLAAGGDASVLPEASANLAQGGDHILRWLSALTAETGNDWGDGLRTLTEAAAPAPVEQAPVEDAVAVPVEPETVIDEPADAGDGADRPNRQNREGRANRQNRENQQNPQDSEAQQGREGRQNRGNRQNQDEDAGQ